jgi:ATP-dependent RNA helicase DHX57
MSGAVELDPEARTIRYFTRDQGRVFVHPASTLFDAQGFSASSSSAGGGAEGVGGGGTAAFLSYFTMVSTSKVFIRELTRKSNSRLLLYTSYRTPR